MTKAMLTSGVVLQACSFHCRRLTAPRALRALFLAISIVCLGSWAEVRAEDAPAAASEQGVKAAFLYKFLSYTEWPPLVFAQPDSPIVVGVMGANDIASELEQITASRTVDKRPVVVRRLRDGDSLAGVHALFVGRADHARLPALARAAQQRAVLTVSEGRGGLEQGAVINLLMIDGRVRFEISAEAAERSGLKLSSRLLTVAHNLRGGA